MLFEEMEMECDGGMRWREHVSSVQPEALLELGSSSPLEYGCHLGKREAALARSPLEILADPPMDVCVGSLRCKSLLIGWQRIFGVGGGWCLLRSTSWPQMWWQRCLGPSSNSPLLVLGTVCNAPGNMECEDGDDLSCVWVECWCLMWLE